MLVVGCCVVFIVWCLLFGVCGLHASCVLDVGCLVVVVCALVSIVSYLLFGVCGVWFVVWFALFVVRCIVVLLL